MDREDLERKSVNCSKLAWCTVQWQTLVNTEMKLVVAYNARNFSIS
jgi:hypothetical protein